MKALQPDTLLLAHDKRVKLSDEDFEKLIERTPNEPRETTLKHGFKLMLAQVKFARKRVNTP